MRLMTHATGYTPDSQRIAYWLQEWNCADNLRTIRLYVPSLTPSHAADVVVVANAAKRDGARPTTLDRVEYIYNMKNIANAHPLPFHEPER